MTLSSLDNFGIALAHSRSQGRLDVTPLNGITSMDEAYAVQREAVSAYGGSPRGYVVEATSAQTQRLVSCDEPIFGPLLDNDLLEVRHQPFRLPYGVLGAGCGFAFIVGLPYPAEGEPITRETVERALVTCHLGLQILGRRVPGTIPLNARTATADFALNVAYHLGPHVAHWHATDLGQAELSIRIDGQSIAQGAGANIMGHPLEAVAWLARALAARGQPFEPGEIVTVGSCVGILQVLPGQTLEVDGGSLGAIAFTFA